MSNETNDTFFSRVINPALGDSYQRVQEKQTNKNTIEKFHRPLTTIEELLTPDENGELPHGLNLYYYHPSAILSEVIVTPQGNVCLSVLKSDRDWNVWDGHKIRFTRQVDPVTGQWSKVGEWAYAMNDPSNKNSLAYLMSKRQVVSWDNPANTYKVNYYNHRVGYPDPNRPMMSYPLNRDFITKPIYFFNHADEDLSSVALLPANTPLFHFDVKKPDLIDYDNWKVRIYKRPGIDHVMSVYARTSIGPLGFDPVSNATKFTYYNYDSLPDGIPVPPPTELLASEWKEVIRQVRAEYEESELYRLFYMGPFTEIGKPGTTLSNVHPMGEFRMDVPMAGFYVAADIEIDQYTNSRYRWLHQMFKTKSEWQALEAELMEKNKPIWYMVMEVDVNAAPYSSQISKLHIPLRPVNNQDKTGSLPYVLPDIAPLRYLYNKNKTPFGSLRYIDSHDQASYRFMSPLEANLPDHNEFRSDKFNYGKNLLSFLRGMGAHWQNAIITHFMQQWMELGGFDGVDRFGYEIDESFTGMGNITSVDGVVYKTHRDQVVFDLSNATIRYYNEEEYRLLVNDMSTFSTSSVKLTPNMKGVFEGESTTENLLRSNVVKRLRYRAISKHNGDLHPFGGFIDIPVIFTQYGLYPYCQTTRRSTIANSRELIANLPVSLNRDKTKVYSYLDYYLVDRASSYNPNKRRPTGWKVGQVNGKYQLIPPAGCHPTNLLDLITTDQTNIPYDQVFHAGTNTVGDLRYALYYGVGMIPNTGSEIEGFFHASPDTGVTPAIDFYNAGAFAKITVPDNGEKLFPIAILREDETDPGLPIIFKKGIELLPYRPIRNMGMVGKYGYWKHLHASHTGSTAFQQNFDWASRYPSKGSFFGIGEDTDYIQAINFQSELGERLGYWEQTNYGTRMITEYNFLYDLSTYFQRYFVTGDPEIVYDIERYNICVSRYLHHDRVLSAFQQACTTLNIPYDKYVTLLQDGRGGALEESTIMVRMLYWYNGWNGTTRGPRDRSGYQRKLIPVVQSNTTQTYAREYHDYAHAGNWYYLFEQYLRIEAQSYPALVVPEIPDHHEMNPIYLEIERINGYIGNSVNELQRYVNGSVGNIGHVQYSRPANYGQMGWFNQTDGEWMPEETQIFHLNEKGRIVNGEPPENRFLMAEMSVYSRNEIYSNRGLGSWETHDRISGGKDFFRSYFRACPVILSSSKRSEHIMYPYFQHIFHPGEEREVITHVMHNRRWDVRNRSLWETTYPPTRQGIEALLSELDINGQTAILEAYRDLGYPTDQILIDRWRGLMGKTCRQATLKLFARYWSNDRNYGNDLNANLVPMLTVINENSGYNGVFTEARTRNDRYISAVNFPYTLEAVRLSRIKPPHSDFEYRFNVNEELSASVEFYDYTREADDVYRKRDNDILTIDQLPQNSEFTGTVFERIHQWMKANPSMTFGLTPYDVIRAMTFHTTTVQPWRSMYREDGNMTDDVIKEIVLCAFGTHITHATNIMYASNQGTTQIYVGFKDISSRTYSYDDNSYLVTYRLKLFNKSHEDLDRHGEGVWEYDGQNGWSFNSRPMQYIWIYDDSDSNTFVEPMDKETFRQNHMDDQLLMAIRPDRSIYPMMDFLNSTETPPAHLTSSPWYSWIKRYLSDHRHDRQLNQQCNHLYMHIQNMIFALPFNTSNRERQYVPPYMHAKLRTAMQLITKPNTIPVVPMHGRTSFAQTNDSLAGTSSFTEGTLMGPMQRLDRRHPSAANGYWDVPTSNIPSVNILNPFAVCSILDRYEVSLEEAHDFYQRYEGGDDRYFPYTDATGNLKTVMRINLDIYKYLGVNGLHRIPLMTELGRHLDGIKTAFKTQKMSRNYLNDHAVLTRSWLPNKITVQPYRLNNRITPGQSWDNYRNDPNDSSRGQFDHLNKGNSTNNVVFFSNNSVYPSRWPVYNPAFVSTYTPVYSKFHGFTSTIDLVSTWIKCGFQPFKITDYKTRMKVGGNHQKNPFFGMYQGARIVPYKNFSGYDLANMAYDPIGSGGWTTDVNTHTANACAGYPVVKATGNIFVWNGIENIGNILPPRTTINANDIRPREEFTRDDDARSKRELVYEGRIMKLTTGYMNGYPLWYSYVNFHLPWHTKNMAMKDYNVPNERISYADIPFERFTTRTALGAPAVVDVIDLVPENYDMVLFDQMMASSNAVSRDKQNESSWRSSWSNTNGSDTRYMTRMLNNMRYMWMNLPHQTQSDSAQNRLLRIAIVKYLADFAHPYEDNFFTEQFPLTATSSRRAGTVTVNIMDRVRELMDYYFCRLDRTFIDIIVHEIKPYLSDLIQCVPTTDSSGNDTVLQVHARLLAEIDKMVKTLGPVFPPYFNISNPYQMHVFMRAMRRSGFTQGSSKLLLGSIEPSSNSNRNMTYTFNMSHDPNYLKGLLNLRQHTRLMDRLQYYYTVRVNNNHFLMDINALPTLLELALESDSRMSVHYSIDDRLQRDAFLHNPRESNNVIRLHQSNQSRNMADQFLYIPEVFIEQLNERGLPNLRIMFMTMDEIGYYLWNKDKVVLVPKTNGIYI